MKPNNRDNRRHRLRVAVLTSCALGLNHTVTCEQGRGRCGKSEWLRDTGDWRRLCLSH